MVEGALAANAPLAIACWRGRSSLAILVSKQECSLLEEKLSAAMARYGVAQRAHNERRADIAGRIIVAGRFC